VVSCCDYDNKPFGFIKSGDFIGLLSNFSRRLLVCRGGGIYAQKYIVQCCNYSETRLKKPG
jgi:hypothetical protein